jgi:hypothetical protein
VEDPQATRKIFTSRRRNRPIGGYAPFEKSRSYIGILIGLALLGFGLAAASWYTYQIDTIARATGRSAGDPWKNEAEGKRKEFRARQKRAMEKLKQLKEKAQSTNPKEG